jgi:hypothetical protein
MTETKRKRSTVSTPRGVLTIEPDTSGNDYVTFGDGTAAVHAGGEWWLIEDPGTAGGGES